MFQYIALVRNSLSDGEGLKIIGAVESRENAVFAVELYIKHNLSGVGHFGYTEQKLHDDLQNDYCIRLKDPQTNGVYFFEIYKCEPALIKEGKDD